MNYLTTKTMPEQSTPLITHILDFATTFIPYTVVFGIFWKLIDAIFKYASEGRDARTRELINQATEPLSKDIRSLTQSIGALGEQIRNMK
jgi:hypothetical protein